MFEKEKCLVLKIKQSCLEEISVVIAGNIQAEKVKNH